MKSVAKIAASTLFVLVATAINVGSLHADDNIAFPKKIEEVAKELKTKAAAIHTGSGSFAEKIKKLNALVKEYKKRRSEEWAKARVVKTKSLSTSQGDNGNPFKTGESYKSARIERPNSRWIVDKREGITGTIAHYHEEEHWDIVTEVKNKDGKVIGHEASAVGLSVKATEVGSSIGTKTSKSGITVKAHFKLSKNGINEQLRDEEPYLLKAAGLVE